MRYWWVNQNQTFRHEVRGSFMWSSKQNAFLDYHRANVFRRGRLDASGI
jgi:hypothetical protein